MLLTLTDLSNRHLKFNNRLFPRCELITMAVRKPVLILWVNSVKKNSIFQSKQSRGFWEQLNFKRWNQQESLIWLREWKKINFNSVYYIRIELLRIGNWLFDLMKPLLFFFINTVNIKYDESKMRSLYKVVFMNDEKTLLSSCFEAAFLMIRKTPVIAEFLRLLLKRLNLLRILRL